MMGSKVLLADDSVTIQKVVGIIFANEDYDLTIVATGDDAIRKAVEITPDAMLVDALMPGKSGYEVCREIRQNPKLSHVAILLMTGAFEVVDEEKNRLSGADEFIVKPFESQSLIDATNRMIALTAQRAGAAPVATPVAAPAEQLAPPVPLAAVAAPSVDDVWASGFDMEPVAEVQAEPVFTAPPEVSAVASPAPVKATADDDLWGAFDMDAFETAAPPVQAQPPVQQPAPVAVTAADDFFSFEAEAPQPVEPPAEDEFIFETAVTTPPVPEVAPTSTGFEPVGEEEISFGDYETVPATAMPIAAAPAEDDFSTISFDEPVSAPAAPQQPVVEIPPPVPPVAQEPEPIVAAVPQPAPIPAAPASLDEAQLRALLSTVSREMIERIVWEVVPDLAEAIIKEEIRKLKAGTA